MKSSDFARLGDWQRKQVWAFNDALNDLVNNKSNSQMYPSSHIHTDIKSLVKKNKGPTLVKRK